MEVSWILNYVKCNYKLIDLKRRKKSYHASSRAEDRLLSDL